MKGKGVFESQKEELPRALRIVVSQKLESLHGLGKNYTEQEAGAVTAPVSCVCNTPERQGRWQPSVSKEQTPETRRGGFATVGGMEAVLNGRASGSQG